MSNRLQVIGLCIDQCGYRRGARLAEFIAEWEVCVRSYNRDVTSEEFAAWWKDSRATTYRRLAEFREAFPQLGPHATPSALMRPLLDRLSEGKRLTGDIPYDLELVSA